MRQTYYNRCEYTMKLTINRVEWKTSLTCNIRDLVEMEEKKIHELSEKLVIQVEKFHLTKTDDKDTT